MNIRLIRLITGLLLTGGYQFSFAEGDVYQEGVDTILTTSCTPPTTRTDGTPITPEEMDVTKIVLSQETLFSEAKHEVIAENIFCDKDIPLSSLGAYGQWHKSAMIHAFEGGWSELAPDHKSFEWLQAVTPPVDYGPALPKQDWVSLYTSSQEIDNWLMPAEQAWDGHESTLWHSQYTPTEAPMPHILEINLGGLYKVSAVQIKPRTGAGNAVIKDVQLYTRLNGTNWRLAWEGQLPAGDSLHTLELPGDNARFLQLLITSEQDGGEQASIAELYAFGEEGFISPPGTPSLTQ